MDIMTNRGLAKNIKVQPYIESSFLLGYISETPFVPTSEHPTGDNEYELLGFDIPIKEDDQWLFWVEHGYCNGEAETKAIELSEDSIYLIKKMYAEYLMENQQVSTT
jgi:hypothetical protein